MLSYTNKLRILAWLPPRVFVIYRFQNTPSMNKMDPTNS